MLSSSEHILQLLLKPLVLFRVHIVCLLQPPNRLLQLKSRVVPALVPYQDSFTYLCARQFPLQLAYGDCVDFLVVSIRIDCP